MKIHQIRFFCAALMCGIVGFASIGSVQAASSKLTPSVNALAGVPASVTLNDTKCVGSTWCVAVGRDENHGSVVMSGNPANWSMSNARDLKGPGFSITNFGGSLSSVDCVSAVWCVAVGVTDGPALPHAGGSGQPRILIGDPASWTNQSFIKPQHGNFLNLVSCISETYCYAFGGSDTGWIFFQGNPLSWASADVQTISGIDGITALSCSAIGSCTALAVVGNAATVFTGDPSTWSATSTDDPPVWTVQNAIRFEDSENVSALQFTSLSCASATFCAATGTTDQGPLTLSGDPATWTRSSGRIWPADGDVRTIDSVSCVDASSCTLVGTTKLPENFPLVLQGDPETLSASDAHVLPNLTGSRSFSQITCTTTVFCFGTINETDQSNGSVTYLVGDASTWASQALHEVTFTGAKFGSNIRVQGFSCPTSVFCVQVSMVNSKLVVLTGNPKKWNTARAKIIDFGNRRLDQFTKIECFTSISCVGVGNGGRGRPVVAWGNPTTWTASSFKETRLDGIANSMSCVSATWCVLAGVTNRSNLFTIAGKPSEIVSKSPKELVLPVSRFGGGAQWTAISCLTKEFCAATGLDGHTNDWQGAHDRVPQPIVAFGSPADWKAKDVREIKVAKSIGVSGRMYGIDCVSADYCAAVGEADIPNTNNATYPIAIAGKPGDWATKDLRKVNLGSAHGYLIQTVNANGEGSLSNVTCQKKASCTVVGWQAWVGNFVGSLDAAKPNNFKFTSLSSVPSLSLGSIDRLSCPTKCYITGVDSYQNSFVAGS